MLNIIPQNTNIVMRFSLWKVYRKAVEQLGKANRLVHVSAKFNKNGAGNVPAPFSHSIYLLSSERNSAQLYIAYINGYP